MYGITGYDKRQFDIKMICRFPVSRGYIAYGLDDDESTEIMFELGRKQTFVGVELYLEKNSLYIDYLRNNPPSTRMLSQDSETCSLASVGNADNCGSPSLGGFAAGTGGCLGSRVGLVQCSSQQFGVGASDGTFDCITVGHGEEVDKQSQTHVENVDEMETVNRERETEGITSMSEAAANAHTHTHAHAYVENEEGDENFHVVELDEGLAVVCEWEVNETEGNTLVSKAIAHAYIANEDGDERAHAHVVDVVVECEQEMNETGENAMLSEATAYAHVANEDGEAGHSHLMHEDVYEEVVVDCEQEMNETQGSTSMSEAIAHAQVGNEDEVPHAHLANDYVQVDAYPVDPGGERNDIEGGASLSVGVSNNNYVEVEKAPANEFTNNDWVNDAVASNHIPGLPVVVENLEPGLRVGQIFQTKQQLQHTVKEYAIRAHREYVVLESTPSLLALKCKNEGCPWRLRAPLKKSVGCFMITKYAGPHTCVNPSTDQDHAQLDAEFICSKILGMIKDQVSITPAAIVAHMQQAYDYNISYMKAWAAKQKALEKIFGDGKECYVEESETADSEVVPFSSMGLYTDEVAPTLEATVDLVQPVNPTEGTPQLTQLTEDEHDAAAGCPPEEKRRVAKRKRR
ncbi:hypothetical protein NE237_016651 [Protea cynaroides]|uniref:Transposase MuDR plant domain-containing protein n=1 Tax=Protea cynaroides TaxID=273540 RepID=A0A9Q0K6H9_9MAGN|nr:hypothetical protein NE237_016651 [Protea cynaroides]